MKSILSLANKMKFIGRLHSKVFQCSCSTLSLSISSPHTDIGANLTDKMFQGIYNGNQKHPSDYADVLNRAWATGLDKLIITVGTIDEADEAINFAGKDERIYITMGCHPTRCGEFVADPENYYKKLCDYIEMNRPKVVAIGECGLDYDRLKFCKADVQRKYFERQLDLVAQYELPLFLHCRNSFDDFYDIVSRNRPKIKAGGVVHSFDGSLAQAMQFIEFGFYIGINGCSLKTEEQLKTVSGIPPDKILVETDCPWCSIRSSHAGSKLIKTKFPTVKRKENWTKDTLIDGRYEPAQIVQVVEVIAALRNESIESLAAQFHSNTMELFFK